MIYPFIIYLSLWFTYPFCVFSMSILLPFFLIFHVFDTPNAVRGYCANPWKKGTLFTCFCGHAWCTGHNGSDNPGVITTGTVTIQWSLFGGRSSILPTDWHVLILCIIFHLENLYFKLKWYVDYGNVLLNLFSQWNLCQYITFYRTHNFV